MRGERCRYRSVVLWEWWDQYIDAPEAYTKWRNTQGDYYLDIQDARDLYYRNLADFRGSRHIRASTATFATWAVKAKSLFLANPRDQWFLPQYVETQVKAIPGARVVWVDSVAGHMICCNADPNATRIIGDAIRAFLQELSERQKTRR
jgi:homoserine O-acetyltransferase